MCSLMYSRCLFFLDGYITQIIIILFLDNDKTLKKTWNQHEYKENLSNNLAHVL